MGIFDKLIPQQPPVPPATPSKAREVYTKPYVSKKATLKKSIPKAPSTKNASVIQQVQTAPEELPTETVPTGEWEVTPEDVESAIESPLVLASRLNLLPVEKAARDLWWLRNGVNIDEILPHLDHAKEIAEIHSVATQLNELAPDDAAEDLWVLRGAINVSHVLPLLDNAEEISAIILKKNNEPFNLAEDEPITEAKEESLWTVMSALSGDDFANQCVNWAKEGVLSYDASFPGMSSTQMRAIIGALPANDRKSFILSNLTLPDKNDPSAMNAAKTKLLNDFKKSYSLLV